MGSGVSPVQDVAHDIVEVNGHGAEAFVRCHRGVAHHRIGPGGIGSQYLNLDIGSVRNHRLSGGLLLGESGGSLGFRIALGRVVGRLLGVGRIFRSGNAGVRCGSCGVGVGLVLRLRFRGRRLALRRCGKARSVVRIILDSPCRTCLADDQKTG